jgi:pyruvate,water dikinase
MGEGAVRNALADLYILGGADRAIPAEHSERMWDVFYGRPAANVDVLRRWADATPFLTGDALARLFYNSDVRRPPEAPVGLRSLAVVVPAQAVRAAPLPWVLRRRRQTCGTWWSTVVHDASSRSVANLAHRLQETYGHLTRVATPHALNNWLLSCLVHQLTRVAEEAGLADRVDDILGGYGSFEESTLAHDLWRVGDGSLGFDAFLDVHGYHGPEEGEMSSLAWREDPAPVAVLIESYAALDAAARPGSTEAERRARRVDAERALIAACRTSSRARVRAILRLTARHLPLRQLGHNASTQMCDAARADVRRLGPLLVASGALADAEDVFYLTVGELTSGLPADARHRVAARRETRARDSLVQLPNEWIGEPQPLGDGPGRDHGELTGVAASGGVARGRARVVTDANRLAAFLAGEVLVCPTTDPSWSAVFPLAAAVVLDTGGRMSHGAIVAREFGLPCVTNTGNATSVFETGDLVEVDGDQGKVRRLEAAAAGPGERSGP